MGGSPYYPYLPRGRFIAEATLEGRDLRGIWSVLFRVYYGLEKLYVIWVLRLTPFSDVVERFPGIAH